MVTADRGPYYDDVETVSLSLGPEECQTCNEELQEGEEVVSAVFHNPGGPGHLETRWFHPDCWIDDEEEDL